MRDREERAPATAGRSGEPRVIVVIDELADLVMGNWERWCRRRAATVAREGVRRW
jgi:hypothetical protein